MLHGRQIFGTFILIITLVGCGMPDGSRDTGQRDPATATPLKPDGSVQARSSIDPALQNTRWMLVEIQGAPPLAGSNITLNFENGQIGGYSGCNSYGAPYPLADKGRLSIAKLASTTRGCLDQAVQQQETAFLQALQQATGYQVRDERFEIMDAHGEIILVFALGPGQAMNFTDLVGTQWALQSRYEAALLGSSHGADCRAEACPL